MCYILGCVYIKYMLKMKIKEQKQENVQYFVRIANTDLEGKKPISVALTKIKGIGSRLSHMICNVNNIELNRKAGTLNKEEIIKIEKFLKSPQEFNTPTWALNRRKDIEDGTDKHIITSDLIFIRDNDIKTMKKIKSYKGVRHSAGLTVRGQRTKSNFRRNKGKSSIGVKKKK